MQIKIVSIGRNYYHPFVCWLLIAGQGTKAPISIFSIYTRSERRKILVWFSLFILSTHHHLEACGVSSLGPKS